MNILLTVSYDGTDYSGWQRQTNALSVQEVMETALTELYSQDVAVKGASRTDAGVHAKGQRVLFTPPAEIPLQKLPKAINGLLPDSIVVTEAEYVPYGFHPITDAKRKTYTYTILNGLRDPFTCRYAWAVNKSLNLSHMQTASQYLLGTHNFLSFCASGGSTKTFVRTIFSLDIRQENDRITIEVTGDGFLYNMVRIIAGTLVDVGRGKLPVNIEPIIKSMDRVQAGQTAPACGLTLLRVDYDGITDIPDALNKNQ